MPKLTVAFFLEDVGQEAIMPPLFKRVVSEEGLDGLECRILHSRGGGSLSAYSKFLRNANKSRLISVDLLIVGSDGNCGGFVARRDEILKKATNSEFTDIIAAVPDPHVERWYLLDIPALEQVSGVKLSIQHVPEKCEKNFYKRLLRKAFEGTEITPPLGGIEYGERIALKMDLYNAGKLDHGLGDFIEKARAWARRQLIA